MNLKHLLLPAELVAAVFVGCDDKKGSGTPAANQPAAKSTDTSAADKAAAAAKAATDNAAADKVAADKAAAQKAAADKVAADKASPDKAAADAKAAADKSAADAKTQGSKLLDNLQTAITDGIIKQLDGLRDKLPADMVSKFDSLKKLYTDNKGLLQNLPGLPK
jgi:hypothetical protein